MNETFPANTPQPPGSGETFPDTAPGRTPTPSTSPAAAINLHSIPDPRPRLTITRRAVQSELARRSLPDFIATLRKLGLVIDDIESNPAYANSGLSVFSVSLTITAAELKKYKTHSEIIEALGTLDEVSHIEEIR